MRKKIAIRVPGWLIILIPIALLLFGGFAVVSAYPSLGAQGADLLRSALGDEAVANLEMVFFQMQDRLQRLKYNLGDQKVRSPWQSTSQAFLPNPKLSFSPEPVPTSFNREPTTTSTPTAILPSTVFTPTPTGTATPPPPTPSPTPWSPETLNVKAKIEAEGTWVPYISDPQGRTVAYRTFYRPDPERPYIIVAAVAFDLNYTRLHYVLGSIEPKSSGGSARTGQIPKEDLVAGTLLAAFNGGFKATHGQFGAMADGVVALPPKPGLGTVAMYQNGSVKIGEWDSDILETSSLAAWRENGPLVIHDGEINPRIYNKSPKDWGYTVNDVSPTWRSAIGISADGRTLFYVAGGGLTMPNLANAMLIVHARQALQLDINNYWVLFVAIRPTGARMITEALFPDIMKENKDRYLHSYTRDYFYITTGEPVVPEVDATPMLQ